MGFRMMKLFGSATSKKVDEFSRDLASSVTRLRPPTNKSGPGSPGVSLAYLEKKVDQLFEKATAFRREHKLGIYKKARLANTFRWELKELGYEESFIEAVTEKLVIALAKKD